MQISWLNKNYLQSFQMLQCTIPREAWSRVPYPRSIDMCVYVSHSVPIARSVWTTGLFARRKRQYKTRWSRDHEGHVRDAEAHIWNKITSQNYKKYASFWTNILSSIRRSAGEDIRTLNCFSLYMINNADNNANRKQIWHCLVRLP